MALQLYTPADGSTVDSPVSVTWEYIPWQNNAWYNLNSDGWVQFLSAEYSCSGGTCNATIDVPADSSASLRIWQNGEYSQTVNFQTSMSGGSTGEITVVVEPDPETLAHLDDLSNKADIVTVILAVSGILVAAFHGFRTGMVR